jgi:hypothetical protein
MGEDILFDCDLKADEAPEGGEDDPDPPVTRVI